MKKLISILALALCFCMVSTVGAQVVASQYSAKMAVSGYDTVAQSFVLEEDEFVQSIRAVVFSRYHSVDHPATLTILSGDGPYGGVIHRHSVRMKSLNKFYSEDVLQNSTSYGIEIMWGEVQENINSSEWGFDDLATTFEVGLFLPAGQYTFMFNLEDDDDSYTINSVDWVTSFTNCNELGGGCYEPYILNPYEGGRHYQGFNLMLHSHPDRDMGFEINRGEDISTSLPEPKPELSIRIVDGVLLVPSDWAGSTLSVTDAIGRQVASFATLRGEEAIQLVRDQVAILTLISTRGERHTTKVLVR